MRMTSKCEINLHKERQGVLVYKTLCIPTNDVAVFPEISYAKIEQEGGVITDQSLITDR
jgi:hypothetical protein